MPRRAVLNAVTLSALHAAKSARSFFMDLTGLASLHDAPAKAGNGLQCHSDAVLAVSDTPSISSIVATEIKSSRDIHTRGTLPVLQIALHLHIPGDWSKWGTEYRARTWMQKKS